MLLAEKIKEKSILKRYFILSIAFGICMGILFRIVTPFFVDFKSEVLKNIFTLLNIFAGYLYLREAVISVTTYLETLADVIIYLGHIKLKSIEKAGKEVSAMDLDLTGKIKSMMSADSDAIGMLYREGNKTILSFKTTDDIICGARPKHLKNQEIVLSEIDEKGNFITHWDKVFVD